jgi:hypothetical protein
MQAKTDKEKRLIAWNGVQLYIPADWEARVSGHRHLVFEKDFQPQLQIRWEKPAQQSSDYLQKRSLHFAEQMGSIISDKEVPPQFQQVKDIFGRVTCYRNASGMLEGGILVCTDHHTLVLFQIFSPEPKLLVEVTDCLSKLSCRNHTETGMFWRIQDFSLTLPDSYILKDYTFGAGLTRLSFFKPELFLQICKLGPADSRLHDQSLEKILITLADTPDLELLPCEGGDSFEGFRTPTIPQQLLFRLRREKPFVRTKIWHDTANNRLLAVVLTSNRPIPPATLHEICRQYAIL